MKTALEFVVCVSNRWLKIEVTARQYETRISMVSLRCRCRVVFLNCLLKRCLREPADNTLTKLDGYRWRLCDFCRCFGALIKRSAAVRWAHYDTRRRTFPHTAVRGRDVIHGSEAHWKGWLPDTTHRVWRLGRVGSLWRHIRVAKPPL